MAQNNPITESGSYASTGGAKAPLDTDSSYGTSTYPSSTTNPTTTTTATHPTTATTTTQPSTGSKLKEAGSELKQILAGVHGAGEKLRGEFNSTVDRTFNEGEGVAKNERVALAGENEMTTGQFSHATKNREGIVPGDHERRGL